SGLSGWPCPSSFSASPRYETGGNSVVCPGGTHGSYRFILGQSTNDHSVHFRSGNLRLRSSASIRPGSGNDHCPARNPRRLVLDGPTGPPNSPHPVQRVGSGSLHLDIIDRILSAVGTSAVHQWSRRSPARHAFCAIGSFNSLVFSPKQLVCCGRRWTGVRTF